MSVKIDKTKTFWVIQTTLLLKRLIGWAVYKANRAIFSNKTFITMFKVLVLYAFVSTSAAVYGVPAADPTPAQQPEVNAAAPYQPAADTASAPEYAAKTVPSTRYAPVQPVPVYYQTQILPILSARHDLVRLS